MLVVSIWQKFKVILAFMIARVNCKNELEKVHSHSKMEALDWSQHFSHFLSLQGFFQTLNGVLLRCQKSDLVNSNSSELMVVLVTCKNKDHPIKNLGTTCRVLARLYVDFLDTQGQLTLPSVLESS